MFVGKDSNAAAELENRTVGDKGISRETWHSVIFSVDSTKAVLTVDNEAYIISEGDFSKLFGSEKYLDSYVPSKQMMPEDTFTVSDKTVRTSSMHPALD